MKQHIFTRYLPTIYLLYCSIPSMFIWRTISILHYYCICPTTFLWTKHFWSRWQRYWDTTRSYRGIERLLLLIWWFVVIQGYTRSLLPLLAVLDALAIVLDLVAYTLSPYWLVLIHDHVVINKLTEDRSELENKARYKSAHLGYNCIGILTLLTFVPLSRYTCHSFWILSLLSLQKAIAIERVRWLMSASKS